MLYWLLFYVFPPFSLKTEKVLYIWQGCLVRNTLDVGRLGHWLCDQTQKGSLFTYEVFQGEQGGPKHFWKLLERARKGGWPRVLMVVRQCDHSCTWFELNNGGKWESTGTCPTVG